MDHIIDQSHVILAQNTFLHLYFTCHNHLVDREMANKIDTNIGI